MSGGTGSTKVNITLAARVLNTGQNIYKLADKKWNQIDRWFSQHFLEADKRFSDYLKSG